MPCEERKQEEKITYVNESKPENPKPVNNRKSAPHGGPSASLKASHAQRGVFHV